MDRWSHIRAAAIALALLGHGVYALPLPGKVTAQDLKKKDAQRDVALWHGWLTSAGVPVEPAQLEQVVIEGSGVLNGLHKALKAPFAPVFELVGANQAWALFASATTHPDRLVVEVQREGSETWEPLLRRLDPCCTWHEEQLEYRRIRGIWDGQQDRMRPGYKNLTLWVAREVFAELPDAALVRVKLERGVATYPWEPDDPTLEIEHLRLHRREAP